MINLSAIPSQSLLGRVLRGILKALPSQAKVPIVQGRLRGNWWIVGSGQHGFWLGSFDYDKQRLFEQLLKPGDVVYDIGAHVGFYTLLASKLVGPEGKVYAFEPLPRNLRYLREHLRLNHVTNVEVVEAAVSDVSEEVAFDQSSYHTWGHLDPNGTLRVRALKLDQAVLDLGFRPPKLVKVNVEGAEKAVLQGAREMIQLHHPIFIVSTHGDTIHRECCALLKEQGYELRSVYGPGSTENPAVLAMI